MMSIIDKDEMMLQVDTSVPGALRFVNFLSPLLQGTYDAIARYVGATINVPVFSGVGLTTEEFASRQADVGFLCGLLYTRMGEDAPGPVEVLVAPVLMGDRYQHQPIYFSDVVVRSDSAYRSFEELAGCRWAYNETVSHSGYNLVCADLLQRGVPLPYFGEAIRSGSHLDSLRMVLAGEVDATAIDSHVLDVVLRRDERLATQVRTVAALGPSTIPPVVVARHLDRALKGKIRQVFLTMHQDPDVRQALRIGRIERFVAIEDEQYNDVRDMFARVQVSNVVL